MILVLNGPFGIGKTTTAEILAGRIFDAMIYDPEIVGAVLRAIFGEVERVDDFQDLSLWPRVTVDVARMLLQMHGRSLIIPMTLARRTSFDSITSGLRAFDRDLVCVRLVASRETLIRRILGRPDAEGPHAWCLAHLEEGMAMARDPALGLAIETDHRPPAEVVDAVMAILAERNGGAEASWRHNQSS